MCSFPESNSDPKYPYKMHFYLNYMSSTPLLTLEKSVIGFRLFKLERLPLVIWSIFFILRSSFVSHKILYLVQETRDKVENGYRMPAPAETPAPVYQLMKDCWTVDPDKRPRFSEILRRLKQIQTHI